MQQGSFAAGRGTGGSQHSTSTLRQHCPVLTLALLSLPVWLLGRSGHGDGQRNLKSFSVATGILVPTLN